MNNSFGFRLIVSVWVRMALPVFIIALLGGLLFDVGLQQSSDLKDMVRDIQNTMYSLHG